MKNPKCFSFCVYACGLVDLVLGVADITLAGRKWKMCSFILS